MTATSACQDCGGLGFIEVVDINGANVEECDCTPDKMPAEVADRLWENLQAEIHQWRRMDAAMVPLRRLGGGDAA